MTPSAHPAPTCWCNGLTGLAGLPTSCGRHGAVTGRHRARGDLAANGFRPGGLCFRSSPLASGACGAGRGSGPMALRDWGSQGASRAGGDMSSSLEPPGSVVHSARGAVSAAGVTTLRGQSTDFPAASLRTSGAARSLRRRPPWTPGRGDAAGCGRDSVGSGSERGRTGAASGCPVWL